jgi:predicted metalloendopeptidase
MRSILEGTYDNVYQNLTGSDEGFHTEDQVENDKHNFDTMQSFYNQCMNQSTLNSLGPTPIYSDISLIENKLFPVNDSTALYSSAANVSMTQTVTLLQHNGVMGFATLFTYIDDKNPDMNAIMFDQPKTLSLPSKEYYTEPGIVELLRSGLNDLVYKVLGDYSNGTTDLELRQSESNRTGFHLWSQEKVQNAVNRFIDFESKLANATLPA